MHESSEHAALLHLLRVAPHQAARLLRRVFGITVPHGVAQVVDPVHKPGSLVPDLVIVFCDPLDPGTPKLVLIVEVQRRIDPYKLLVWPAYLWLERLRRRCECHLLVLAPDPAVAAWAERPITCGPGCSTQAMVLGRPLLFWYAVAVGLLQAAFVHYHEEPALRRRYGSRYEAYRREVPLWWPR